MKPNETIKECKEEIRRIGLDNRRYIRDIEVICQALFSPMRYNKDQIVQALDKMNEIHKKHIVEQEKMLKSAERLVVAYTQSKDIELKVS